MNEKLTLEEEVLREQFNKVTSRFNLTKQQKEKMFAQLKKVCEISNKEWEEFRKWKKNYEKNLIRE